MLLLQRAATLRSHAGQVAFPGGATDPGDARPDRHRAARGRGGGRAAARTRVEVLAELPALFLPPSGFVVTPVLAYWREPHPVGVVDAGEVAAVAPGADRRAGRSGQPVHGAAPVRLRRARVSRSAACSSGGSPPACSTGCCGWPAGSGRGTATPASGPAALTEQRPARHGPLSRRPGTVAAWYSAVGRRCSPVASLLALPLLAGCQTQAAINREPHTGATTAAAGRRACRTSRSPPTRTTGSTRPPSPCIRARSGSP